MRKSNRAKKSPVRPPSPAAPIAPETWPSWALPLACALISFVVLFAAYNPAPPTGGDDATYLALARSLLNNGEYRDIWDPLRPPHVQYPPLFPLLLAGGLVAGLTPAFGLKVVIIVFAAAAVGLSVAWATKTGGAAIAAAVGLFLSLSPGIAILSHSVLSDIPFWAVTALALLLWTRYAERANEKSFRSPADEATAVGIATAVTVVANFTRSAGLPLVAAAAAWLIYRRRWRALMVFFVIAVPPIILWWLRTRSVGHAGYVAPFLARNPYDPSQGTIGLSDFPRRIADNAGYYVTRHLPMAIIGRTWPGAALAFPVVALAIGGWIRRLRKPGIVELWVPMYVGLVLVWPATWSSERFILPLFPLLLVYAAETLLWILRPTGWLATPAALTAGVVVLGFLLSDLSRELRNSAACRENIADGNIFACTPTVFADFFHLADEARGKLPSGSVVLSRKPSVFFVRSGYRSALYPLNSDPARLFATADSVGAKYLVVDQIPGIGPRYLHPIMLKRRDDFCIVNELSFPNASLAKIDTTAPPRIGVKAANSFRGCPLNPAAMRNRSR